ADLFAGCGVALLDLCGGLLDGEPRRVHTTAAAACGLRTVLLEFPGGRAAQVTRRRAPATRSALRVQVVGERGTASVRLPRRLDWATADGRFTHVLPAPRPAAQTLLEQFHSFVVETSIPTPGPDHAFRALGWLRAAARSLAEQQPVPFAV